VIAGAKAMYTGTGCVFGLPGKYDFKLTAVDGQINGGGGMDKFRIRIWARDLGEENGLIYDNKKDQAILWGKIVIREDAYLAPASVPEVASLPPPFPTPANPEVWIPYRLGSDSEVVIRVYDVAGRLVRTLDLGYRPVGFYDSKAKAAYWDGHNAQGETVASGVYFYTLQAGDFAASRKLLIIR
jgi:hypothetical protein